MFVPYLVFDVFHQLFPSMSDNFSRQTRRWRNAWRSRLLIHSPIKKAICLHNDVPGSSLRLKRLRGNDSSKTDLRYACWSVWCCAHFIGGTSANIFYLKKQKHGCMNLSADARRSSEYIVSIKNKPTHIITYKKEHTQLQTMHWCSFGSTHEIICKFWKWFYCLKIRWIQKHNFLPNHLEILIVIENVEIIVFYHCRYCFFEHHFHRPKLFQWSFSVFWLDLNITIKFESL